MLLNTMGTPSKSFYNSCKRIPRELYRASQYDSLNTSNHFLQKSAEVLKEPSAWIGWHFVLILPAFGKLRRRITWEADLIERIRILRGKQCGWDVRQIIMWFQNLFAMRIFFIWYSFFLKNRAAVDSDCSQGYRREILQGAAGKAAPQHYNDPLSSKNWRSFNMAFRLAWLTLCLVTPRFWAASAAEQPDMQTW